MATELYRRILDFEYRDFATAATMCEVWQPTPFVVEAWTDRSDSPRDRAMLDWCQRALGPPSSPIHGHAGRWHRGCATIHGWTWFGFASEPEMRRFLARWPQPSDAAHGIDAESAGLRRAQATLEG